VLVADGEFVARLRAGDQSAFAAMVREWSPVMLRVARAHVRSSASAEDVVQEAWIGVIRGLSGFEGRSQLRTWVFRILVNVSRRRGRLEAPKQAELEGPTVDPDRFRPASDPEYPRHWRDESAPVAWGPELALMAGEARAALAAGLLELSECQRAVVELRDVHDLRSEEVCELLDLTPGNQRLLLHRGRARLRTILERTIQ